MVSGIKSVATPGPYTVVITLSQPSTSFLDYLAAAYGPVMESPTALAAHAGSDHDQTYLQTHDIGTGPYTLTEAKVGVSYQLQAFPGYWGSQPYYTTVNLPVIDSLSTEEIELNNGQLAGILHDLTTTAAAQYQKSSKLSFYELPVFENEMVYVNENKGPFTSQAFRQAFLEAINIPAIVAGVFPGGRATVPDQISPAHLLDPQYAHQTIKYDPSALAKLVSALPSSQRSIVLGYDTGAPGRPVDRRADRSPATVHRPQRQGGGRGDVVDLWRRRVGEDRQGSGRSQRPDRLLLARRRQPVHVDPHQLRPEWRSGVRGLQRGRHGVPGQPGASKTGDPIDLQPDRGTWSSRAAAGSTWPTRPTPWCSSPGCRAWPQPTWSPLRRPSFWPSSTRNSQALPNEEIR